MSLGSFVVVLIQSVLMLSGLMTLHLLPWQHCQSCDLPWLLSCPSDYSGARPCTGEENWPWWSPWSPTPSTGWSTSCLCPTVTSRGGWRLQ
jgi:hypothetical protein